MFYFVFKVGVVVVRSRVKGIRWVGWLVVFFKRF